jgi:4-hydroxy-tetrahydrodipicolinate reductase
VRTNPPAADCKARVILWGLGALGGRMMKAFAAGIPDVRIVGAIDHDKKLAGKRLGALFEGAPSPDIIVQPTLEACMAGLDEAADVIYHMTESVLAAIQGQLEGAMAVGLNVISASEAMFHPALRFRPIADSLDRVARKHGVSITGCGINPGYVFDSLPLVLARVSSAITGVTINRVIDVHGTGPHDIDHVGYALWPAEFDEKIKTGRIVGHMGMPESIAAIAERMNIPIDRIDESWETSTAKFPVDSGSALGMIEPGRIIGIAQQGVGMVGERRAIVMRLVMFYEPARHGLVEADEIIIEGTHRVHCKLTPAAISIFGAGLMIINATHDLINAPPGLHSILDFSMGGNRRGLYRLALDPKRPPTPARTWLVREAT